MEGDRRCENCRFYVGWECRRYPPTPVAFGDYVGTYFPEVAETQWCGEYQPRPTQGQGEEE